MRCCRGWRAIHASSPSFGRRNSSSVRRYRELGEELRWLARAGLASGLHVHVAVNGAEHALVLHNALRSDLPEIAALAANSPFYEARDTRLNPCTG
jgi:carboxylate-amine ligase